MNAAVMNSTAVNGMVNSMVMNQVNRESWLDKVGNLMANAINVVFAAVCTPIVMVVDTLASVYHREVSFRRTKEFVEAIFDQAQNITEPVSE